MNTYTTTHRAKCPNGILMDEYAITIRSASTIIVEDLIAILKAAPSPIYQEDLADYLKAKLGCAVTVEGSHYGIHVRCER